MSAIREPGNVNRQARSRMAAIAGVAMSLVFAGLIVTAASVSAATTLGSPDFWPLRGTNTVGCTWANPGCPQTGYHPYKALDIKAAPGQAVFAAGVGEVVDVVADQSGNCSPKLYTSSSSCPKGSKGNKVIVKHANNVYTAYLHFSAIAAGIKKGAAVSERTVLGYAGDSGYSDTGFYHLHFEKMVGTTSMGSSASVEPSLKACATDGSVQSYPAAANATSWAQVSYGTPVFSDCTLDPLVLQNSIIRRSDGVSWVIVNGFRRHLPDYATDLCARTIEGKNVTRTGLTAALADTLPEGAAYVCALPNRILRATDTANPQKSYAFHDGKRFSVPDAWTYGYLASHGYPVLDLAQADILPLPDGGTEPAKIDTGAVPANTIIRRTDGVSWVLDGNKVRHHIPAIGDDVCHRYLGGKVVAATGLTDSQARAFTEAEPWPCVIGERIVRSSDGASYVVTKDNGTRWIPDTDTFAVLARQFPVSGPWAASDVNALPKLPRMPYQLNVPAIVNSIVCRSDGVCWAVDGSGIRHHIPTYADNVCWRWVNGWKVTRNGLNSEQADSIGEGAAWGCSLNGRIIATNEGAAYYMDGNTRRWIQDVESFYCYADRGSPVIRGMSMGEAAPIGEGSWMPRCLSPNRVKNKVVRVSDGTAYFIDANGWWYWIPDGGVWNCLATKYGVLINNATWEQVNSIRRERGVWAYCGQ